MGHDGAGEIPSPEVDPRHSRASDSLRMATMPEKSPDEALRQAEERFRLIVESAREFAIFTMELRGPLVTLELRGRANPRLREAESSASTLGSSSRPKPSSKAPRAGDAKCTRRGPGRTSGGTSAKDGSRFWADGFMMPLRTSRAGPAAS